MSDDFYVGYFPKAPAGLGKWVARIALGLVLAGLAVAAVLILRQPPFAASKFEFGEVHEHSGIIEEWPSPMLVSNDGRFLLVSTGKHGQVVKGLQGKSVRLKGTLIQRGAERMLEVVPDSIMPIPALNIGTAGQSVALGAVKLRGEIVDGKCYLGVMNPGNGKVHRDCAVRCISGGVPAAFVVQDASGESRTLLLLGPGGQAINREVLPFVAEPLEIAGELLRSGPTLVLQADPSQFRRVRE